MSQNGWEYTGYVYIDCNEVKKDEENPKVIYADGIRIEFDEVVGDIY